MDIQPNVLFTFLVGAIAFFTVVHIRRRNSFLSRLRGPESPSFWIGKRWSSTLLTFFWCQAKEL